MNHRIFLEPPSSGVDSYIVVRTDRRDHGDVHYVSIHLKIADCSRAVTLEFDMGTHARTKEDALKKLAKLEDALWKVRKAIEEA